MKLRFESWDSTTSHTHQHHGDTTMDPHQPYGINPDDPEALKRLKGFANQDRRTYAQFKADQPKVGICSMLSCACGCFLLIPVMLVPLGLLFA